MKCSASVLWSVVLLCATLGGCFSGGGESKPAAPEPAALAETGPASEVEGFDPVTLGMVSLSETFCVALDPYDEDRITAAVSTFAQHPVKPKVEADSTTWIMLGPQGRLIILKRDTRPKKYRCTVNFTYAHAPTAVYWLDKFAERFAKAGSGQVVKLPQKEIKDGAKMDARLIIARGVPLIFAVVSAKSGALSVIIGNMEPKKTET